MSDAINPKHYQFSNGVQVIDITENLTSNGGQAVQYIARSTRLDGVNKGSQVEDLDKAIWFCQRERERIDAEAVAAPVEAPVARVFNEGDPEPADKETIALSGTCRMRGRKVRLKWGQVPREETISWWNTREGEFPNYSGWDFWLENYGPLTEIL